MSKKNLLFNRLDRLEWQTSRYFTRLNHHAWIAWFFKWISRLGDYFIWLILCLSNPFFWGRKGWILALCWLLCALAAGLFYRFIKNACCRERPYISYNVISCVLKPLDRYSFPSGHSLHAALFTTLVYRYSFGLFIEVISFTFLIALSRLILGLHYLSDIIGGIFIGTLIGALGIYSIDFVLSGWF